MLSRATAFSSALRFLRFSRLAAFSSVVVEVIRLRSRFPSRGCDVSRSTAFGSVLLALSGWGRSPSVALRRSPPSWSSDSRRSPPSRDGIRRRVVLFPWLSFLRWRDELHCLSGEGDVVVSYRRHQQRSSSGSSPLVDSGNSALSQWVDGESSGSSTAPVSAKLPLLRSEGE